MRAGILSLAVVLLLAAGCRGVQTPTLMPEGPIEYQQSSVQRFDGYPEPDTAPNVLGGRPREYDRPIAEPSRARWGERTWFKRFGF